MEPAIFVTVLESSCRRVSLFCADLGWFQVWASAVSLMYGIWHAGKDQPEGGGTEGCIPGLALPQILYALDVT